MSEQRYRGWGDLDHLLQQMDRWFLRGPGHGAAGSIPRVNAWHTNDSVFLSAEVPGLGPDDVAVEIDGETLTISGEVKRETTEEGVNWHRAERAPGKFSRQFVLPFRVDADGVQATCRDGVLTLRMDKCPKLAPRRIAVAG